MERNNGGAVVMAHVLLFASARLTAGTNRVETDAHTVGEAITDLAQTFGDEFTAILSTSMVCLDTVAIERGALQNTPIFPNSELAILPPVSGG